VKAGVRADRIVAGFQKRGPVSSDRRSHPHYLVCGQVERMRAEGCGIAQTANQELQAAPNPVPLFREGVRPTVKEMCGIFMQRTMTQPNARTVRHLVSVFTASERRGRVSTRQDQLRRIFSD
jgi:hypothetical protein